MLKRRHAPAALTLNLMPLIDMALMLTVFFVLCLAASDAAGKAMPVALPKAGTGEPAANGPLEVVIERTGTITIAGKTVDLAGLAAAATPGCRVAVVADRDVKHGRVVEVVDALRKAGVGEVYYAVTPAVQDW